MRRKKIKVNGQEYVSIREAARMIAISADRNENTIVKELRSLWNGRSPWKMYGVYLVEKVD